MRTWRHRHLVSYSRSHSRIQTQSSGPKLMLEWEHLCSCVHMCDLICSHMCACVNACVCVYVIQMCEWQSQDSSPDLSDAKDAFLCYIFKIKKRIVTDISVRL